MFELPKAHFERLLPLFDPNQLNSTMIFSTLTGRTPGQAYVDSLDQPQRCLLTIDFLNFSFLGGIPDQPWLIQAITELRQRQAIHLSWPPHRADSLELPAPPDGVMSAFEFYDSISPPLTPIAEGYQLRIIDNELFVRCVWHDEILMVFGTAENFLRHGIGLCLMKNDEICSEAYACWLGAGKFELGIVTHEQHRQRGYAYLTCQHLIKFCEAKGYPTAWSCAQDNLASAALAHKLGYQTQRAFQWLYYSRVG
ncbi:GNAT family N-acetyltransferase [soil metagenome]